MTARLYLNTYRLIRKNKERIQKFKETGDPRYIYQSKLENEYFQHDMAYMVHRKIYPEEQLLKKFYLIRHLQLLVIQSIKKDVTEDSPQWLTNFLRKNLERLLLSQEQALLQNIINWLTNYRPITRKFKNRKVYSSLGCCSLGCRQYKKRVKFLLCAIDIYSNYAWVVPLRKEILQSSLHFKNFWISLVVNQTRYEKIRVVKFAMDQ